MDPKLRGEASFCAECQNERLAQTEGDIEALGIDAVASNINGRGRGGVPAAIRI